MPIRILVVSHRAFLFSHGGARLYAERLIEALAERGEVEVAVPTGLGPKPVVSEQRTPAGATYRLHLLPQSGSRLARRAVGMLSPWPSYAFAEWSRSALATLSRLISEFDPALVAVDHRLATGALLRDPKSFRGRRIMYLMHNAEHLALRGLARSLGPGPAALGALLDAWRCRLAEAWVARRSEVVACISQDDLDALAADAPNARCRLAPPALPEQPAAPCDPSRLLLVGSFDWLPKRRNAAWLASHVLPVLLRAHPAMRLVIAGQGSDSLGPELAAAGAPMHAVQLFGEFSDPGEVYGPGGVAVVPERQPGGVKLKSLEAAARGLAIVATRAGLSGTRLRPGVEALCESGAAGFVAALHGLAANRSRAVALGAAAQAHVRSSFGTGYTDALWRTTVAEALGGAE